MRHYGGLLSFDLESFDAAKRSLVAGNGKDSAGKFKGVAPETVLGTVPTREVTVTAEHAAINAVMAGCAPEYLPVVGAAVEAIAAPEFNLLGIATTTGSATVSGISQVSTRSRTSASSSRA